MKSWQEAIKDGAVSGGMAGVVMNLATAAAGQVETGHAAATLNAVSHSLWGDEAAREDGVSAKYTLNGLALNEGATVMWASVYEKLFGHYADRGQVPMALLGGAAVAGLAYVVDYHLVPKRLTPGYEKRLSKRGLGALYGVLALSLALGGLLKRKRPA